MQTRNWYSLLTLAHLAATLYMVGLIWFVQVVHYPMYANVGDSHFREYENTHVRLTTYVTMPIMLLELVTGILLFFSKKIPKMHLSIGFGLIAVIWLSTFFLQVPLHNRLSQGFDMASQEFLVHSNWIRTLAWTLRGVLVLLLVRVK